MITKKREVAIGKIIDAALDLLRSEGMLALTQPRVAQAAGLRQSHITYYFPTRSDLVAAVAASVAERLRAGFASAAAAATEPEMFGARMARIGTPEQTRLLVALVLAAESEPAVRRLFRRLTKDVRGLIAAGLAQQGIEADAQAVALLHALGVGLAVLDLARAEPASRREIRDTTERALRLIAKPGGRKG